MWGPRLRSVIRLAAAAVPVGFLFGVACTGPYMSTTEGMSTGDVCPVGSEGCACTPGGTCDEPLICASKVCVSAVDTTGDTPVTTTSASSDETGSATVAGECSPADDRPSDQCAADTPYCNTAGRCVDCSGIAGCAGVDSEKPVCDEASGKCVACDANDLGACAGATPICEDMSCRACAEHAECPGGACDLATGECFAAEDALWIEGGGACDDAGAGTEAAPLCTIKAALAKVAAGPKDTPRALRVGGATYVDALTVPSGHVVAIVREGAEAVKLTGKGAEALKIESGARVYLDHLDISGNADGDGIACAGAEVWIDDVVLGGHGKSGVAAANCVARVRATIITKNVGEGLYVAGGKLFLENTFVTLNGGIDGRGGVALAGGAKAEVVYSTLVANAAGIGYGHTIDCDPAEPGETLTVRNSIALNKNGYSTILCSDAETIDHSALSQETDDPMDDNVGVLEAETATLLTQEPSGVYRPKLGTKIEAIAVRNADDPAVDFENDPRPEQSYPGADEP